MYEIVVRWYGQMCTLRATSGSTLCAIARRRSDEWPMAIGKDSRRDCGSAKRSRVISHVLRVYLYFPLAVILSPSCCRATARARRR